MHRSLQICFVMLALFVTVKTQGYTIEQYLNIKSANSPVFSPDGKSLAFLTNITGTAQIWSVKLPAAAPRQLTNYEDNIGFVRWAGDGIIFGKAKGGDENTQFYWMKPDGTGVRALTDEPGVRHNFGLISDDGSLIVYSSNKRDRKYFDIYGMNLATGKEALLYQQDGNNDVIDMDISGRLIVSRDGTELSLDNNLYLVNSRTNAETLLTAHDGSAEFSNAHFTADGLVFTHNDKREFAGLAQMRKKNAAGDDWSDANRESTILDDSKWDIGDIEMAPYGNTIAYTTNREGFSELYLRKYETGGKPLITVIDKTSEEVKLPGAGIVGGMAFNHDQTQLAFSFSSPTRNSDIWLYDIASKKLVQVTRSDTAGISPQTFTEPRLIKFKSFDSREISAWYYEPQRTRNFSLNMKAKSDRALTATKAPIPVIVSVHGGPEGQERPGFSALYQYYISRGYGILATNVRGSTGYGKAFTHLDDVKKREDSVKDLAWAVEWLKTAGEADPKRIAVMGGSYGGYMTLAAITLYPEIWSAAVDTVGIANWESFLKNTSGYRRRQREVEYGRLDRDLDFLRAISPLAKADRIRCPLFVIAGRNDPRVPWTEAEQIVAAVKKSGGTVQYKIYEDEGHGVSKLKNRLELYPLVADFLDTYMKK